LISELGHDGPAKGVELDTATLEHVADWLIANVDMVPKGTLDLSAVAAALKGHHD
jgi:hypothetical protein